MTESELQNIEVLAGRYNGAGVTTVLKLIQEIRIAREKIIELENLLEVPPELKPDPEVPDLRSFQAALAQSHEAAIQQIQVAVDSPVIAALQTEVAGSLAK